MSDKPKPASEAEIAHGVESLSAAVALIDVAGKLRYVNAAFEERAAVERAQVLGQPFTEVVGLKPEEYEAAMEVIRRGASIWNGRWVAVLADNSPWIQDVQISALPSEGGEAQGCMLVIRDLTNEDSMAERLTSASSVAAINSLAAGVAHEINNPLSFITGNVVYLKEEFERLSDTLGESVVEDWSSALEDLHEGALRVRDIVQQLGRLAKDSGETLGHVDLSGLLETTLALVQNQIRHRATLVREYTEVGLAWSNGALVSEALLNILLNAIESMHPGRKDVNELRVVIKPAAGHWLTIEVRDTGAGISDEVLPHIFDPFFSTKPVGDGSGMGLTVARRLITEVGGHLAVRSTEGQGTSFVISLPYHDAPEESADSFKGTLPARQAGKARILVVDDELAVLRMVERILSAHHVQTCDEGSAAMELIESQEFDLIFCDLMMPEISGQELHTQVQAKHPDIADRFVFITGGAFTQEAMDFAKSVNNALIEKPFSPTQLRELVDQVLGS